MLQTIFNLQRRGHPPNSEIRMQAAPLLEKGWLEQDGKGDLRVPDEIQWALAGIGHPLR